MTSEVRVTGIHGVDRETPQISDVHKMQSGYPNVFDSSPWP
jgi:hypothetical protein